MACLTEAQIEQLVEGRLDPPTEAAVQAHLVTCAECRDLLEEGRANHLFAMGVRRVLPGSGRSQMQSDIAGDSGFYQRFLDGPASIRAGQPIPGYRLIREIHSGGQGIVYEAVQESVGRRVALKIIREGLLAGDDARRRFEREVELAATLHHPNIVTIHDSGVHNGRYYFAMKYVDGQQLDDYLQNQKLSRNDKLVLFRSICDAVHHAHQRGVIHRDLKPTNLLVGADGSPCVLDFGLAKAIGQPDNTQLSIIGQVMGTLAYMSPEQARGEVDLDTRTDIYSLGVILYRMLTGQFPYEVVGPFTQVLKTIVESEPARPAAICAGIGNELETILLKTLSKDRDRRYDSLAALSEDVRRLLHGEAIEAKRDSSLYVLKKTLIRHRIPVLVAALFLAIISVSITSLAFAHREAKDAKVAEASQRRQLNQQTYASNMNLAYRAFDEANVKLTLDMLDRCEQAGTPEDLRGFEWSLLKGLCRQEFRTLQESGADVTATAFSPDGATLATTGSDGTITLWDAITWSVRCAVRAGESPVNALAFSHHSNILATGSGDRIIRLRDAGTGRLISSLIGHVGPIVALAFSPDDQVLAAASGETREAPCDRRLWDLSTGRNRGPLLPGDELPTRTLAFTPDGRTLVMGGSQTRANDSGHAAGVVRLLDCLSGQVVRTFPDQETQALCLAVSPDGKLLATATGAWNITGSVQVWELASGHLLHTLRGHRAQVFSLAFSPDGQTLATASQDCSVRLWNAGTGADRGVIRGLADWATSVAFHPAGTLLVTGSKGGQLKLWETSRVGCVPRLAGHKDEVWGVAYSPDGTRLISACRDQTAILWDSVTGRQLAALSGHSNYVYKAVFSPDGRQVATLSCETKLWDSSSYQEIVTLPTHGSHATAGAFTPDGKTLAVTYKDAVVILWDLPSGREHIRLQGHGGEIYGAAITPDGKTLITSGGKSPARDSLGEIILWDLGSGRLTRRLNEPGGWVIDVAVSRDGRFLATGGFDQTVKLWHLPSGELLHTLRGHANTIGGVTFSPDGKTLASGSWDDTVKLWHVTTGQELATLRANTNGVTAVIFSPDSRTLAAAGRDGSVRLWPAGNSTLGLAPNRLPPEIPDRK